MSKANYDTPLLSLSDKVQLPREERREMCEGAYMWKAMTVGLSCSSVSGDREGQGTEHVEIWGIYWTVVRRVELDRLIIGAWFRYIDVTSPSRFSVSYFLA
ncbi:hypothetical protein BDN67DRAFT_976081 [Paxillus ammoniavirescens]|nr:hypothetical protein BDN67DRAFT_976081 [Paxillus ammoniavirescens]